MLYPLLSNVLYQMLWGHPSHPQGSAMTNLWHFGELMLHNCFVLDEVIALTLANFICLPGVLA